jgi:hypothetical protein
MNNCVWNEPKLAQDKHVDFLVDNCECQNKYGYTTDHTSIKWLQLTQGYLKCNVDATFSDTAGATC